MIGYNAYGRELSKEIKNIEIALKYYIQENQRLSNELDYYKNAYENRVNEFLKEKIMNKELEEAINDLKSLSPSESSVNIILGYLIRVKEENEAVWHKNTEIEYELEMTRDELTQCKREMTDFNDCWLHKDKLRKVYNDVEISDYISCVEFVIAVKKLLEGE